jgi:hypothetical protein
MDDKELAEMYELQSRYENMNAVKKNLCALR